MEKRSREEWTEDLLRRISAFSEAAHDPIPDSPGVRRVIVEALLDRITAQDRTAGLWCRLIIHGLAARDRAQPGAASRLVRRAFFQGLAPRERDQRDCLVLRMPEACPEVEELRSGKPRDLPYVPESGLLNFLDDLLKEYPVSVRPIRRLNRMKFLDDMLKRVSLPGGPGVSRGIVEALLDRITAQDRRTGTWCRLIVQGLAARERDQQDCLVLREPEACPEVEELRSGKPHDPSHLPGLLKFQNDWLKQYFRTKKVADGRISPSRWVRKERGYIFKNLTAYRCLCTFRKSFDDLRLGNDSTESVVRLELLAFLHRMENIVTVESMLKPSRTQLHALPPIYLR